MSVVAKDKAFRLALVDAAGRVYAASIGREGNTRIERKKFALEATQDFLKFMSEEVLHDDD
jgi:hypothetical protein